MWQGLSWGSATWHCHCNLGWPMGTAGRDRRDGSFGPPPSFPRPINIFCLSSPFVGVSRRKFEKMHSSAVISGCQTITWESACLLFCLQSIDALSCDAQKKSH